MSQFRITLSLLWDAESKDEAMKDLLEETDNPDSMLFKITYFNIEEIKED